MLQLHRARSLRCKKIGLLVQSDAANLRPAPAPRRPSSTQTGDDALSPLLRRLDPQSSPFEGPLRRSPQD